MAKSKKFKEYHKNPRKISGKQLNDLKETIKELGDISGIVIDLNSNEIISGNQRSKVIDINDCEIEIIQRNDVPDEFGTVAYGYAIWNGVKMNYREVRWTEKQREKANIVANKGGGTWDFEVLKEFEKEDLERYGFDKKELEALENQDNEQEGEQYDPSQFANGGQAPKTQDCQCPKCGFKWKK